VRTVVANAMAAPPTTSDAPSGLPNGAAAGGAAPPPATRTLVQ
jgi:hypothetical protein